MLYVAREQCSFDMYVAREQCSFDMYVDRERCLSVHVYTVC